MREFNIANMLDTAESSLRKEVDIKMKDMGEKWKEVQMTVQNLAQDASEAFRIRGESARRVDEALHWREKHKHESAEREKLQKELNQLSNEFETFKTNRRKTNESIMMRNSILMKKLSDEIDKKNGLIDDILDEDSSYNQLSEERKREHLLFIRGEHEKSGKKSIPKLKLRRTQTLESYKTTSYSPNYKQQLPPIT